MANPNAWGALTSPWGTYPAGYWDSVPAVLSPNPTSWNNVTGTWGSYPTNTWQDLPITQVAKTLDIRWNIKTSVGKTLQFVWNVKSLPVGKSLGLQWNTRHIAPYVPGALYTDNFTRGVSPGTDLSGGSFTWDQSGGEGQTLITENGYARNMNLFAIAVAGVPNLPQIGASQFAQLQVSDITHLGWTSKKSGPAVYVSDISGGSFSGAFYGLQEADLNGLTAAIVLRDGGGGTIVGSAFNLPAALKVGDVFRLEYWTPTDYAAAGKGSISGDTLIAFFNGVELYRVLASVSPLWDGPQSVRRPGFFITDSYYIVNQGEKDFWDNFSGGTLGATPGPQTKTLELKWNVAQATVPVATPVGVNLGLVWNVQTTTSKSLQTVWNTSAVTSKSLQGVWNVRALVAKPVDLRWNVTSLVFKSLGTVWNVRTLTTKSLDQRWNVYTLTTKSLDVRWNVYTVAFTRIKLYWNVNTSVNQSLELKWAVAAPIGGPFQPTDLAGCAIWFDASQLSAEPIDPWPNLANPALPGTMVGSPAPSLRTNALNGKPVVRFNTNQARVRITNTDIDLNWTILYVGRMWGTAAGRIVDSIYPPSNLLIGYWNGFEDVFYIEGFTVPDIRKSQTTNWHFYTGTGEGVPGDAKVWLYSNGVFISGDHQVTGGWKGNFAINGYSPTGTEETCDCEVAEVIQYNRKLSDVERKQVEDYLNAKWFGVVAPQPVGKSLGLSWNVQQNVIPVGKSLAFVWNTQQTVSKSLGLQWNVAQTTTNSLGLVWNLAQTTSKSLQTVWNLRQTTFKALELDWAIRATVTNQVSLVWRILNQPVGKSVGFVWNVTSVTGKSTSLVWNIKATTAAVLLLRWNTASFVTTNIQFIWRVYHPVPAGVQRQFLWKVAQLAGNEVSIRWNTRLATTYWVAVINGQVVYIPVVKVGDVWTPVTKGSDAYTPIAHSSDIWTPVNTGASSWT